MLAPQAPPGALDCPQIPVELEGRVAQELQAPLVLLEMAVISGQRETPGVPGQPETLETLVRLVSHLPSSP
jgi:hypothetical protein